MELRSRIELYLARYQELPTIEELAALLKALTGQAPTVQEIEAAQRILDEARGTDTT